jgi:hypothetical protein
VNVFWALVERARQESAVRDRRERRHRCDSARHVARRAVRGNPDMCQSRRRDSRLRDAYVGVIEDASTPISRAASTVG